MIHSVPVCRLAKASLSLPVSQGCLSSLAPSGAWGRGFDNTTQAYLSLHPSTCTTIHKLMTREDILQYEALTYDIILNLEGNTYSSVLLTLNIDLGRWLWVIWD